MNVSIKISIYNFALPAAVSKSRFLINLIKNIKIVQETLISKA